MTDQSSPPSDSPAVMAAFAAELAQALQADNPAPAAPPPDPNSPFALVAAEAMRLSGEAPTQGLEPLQTPTPPTAAPVTPPAVPEWQQAIQALTATVAQLVQAQQQPAAQPAAPVLTDEQRMRQEAAEMRAAGLNPAEKNDWISYRLHKQNAELRETLLGQLEAFRAEVAEARQQSRTAAYQGTVEQAIAQSVGGRTLPDVTRQHILKDALSRVASGADPAEATRQALAPFGPLLASMPQAHAPSLMPAQLQGTPQQAQQRLAAAAAVAVPGGTHGRQARSVKDLSLAEVEGLMAGNIMDSFRRS